MNKWGCLLGGIEKSVQTQSASGQKNTCSEWGWGGSSPALPFGGWAPGVPGFESRQLHLSALEERQAQSGIRGQSEEPGRGSDSAGPGEAAGPPIHVRLYTHIRFGAILPMGAVSDSGTRLAREGRKGPSQGAVVASSASARDAGVPAGGQGSFLFRVREMGKLRPQRGADRPPPPKHPASAASLTARTRGPLPAIRPALPRGPFPSPGLTPGAA